MVILTGRVGNKLIQIHFIRLKRLKNYFQKTFFFKRAEWQPNMESPSKQVRFQKPVTHHDS